MNVLFQDFRASYEELREEFDVVYRRFMESGCFVLGNEVNAFEKEYACYCKSCYCVGVGSGLDALHLALRAFDCGIGDEVIVASNTYIATWLAVTHVGAVVVPVEPDEKTYNLNAALIERAVTSRTKAILATNLYGQPCDYDSIRTVADRHGLFFLVDNAQAQGARYKGQRVGGLADAECHSFYPSKNLGAFGEAGAVTTNHIKVADSIKVLRNYGSRVRYHNEVIGYNSRLDELQAAFLRVKLRHLDDWNRRRNNLARIYLEGLMESECVVPFCPDWAESVWHLFVIRHSARDALHNQLAERGIQTIIHYPIPPHLSDAYAFRGFNRGAFPITEKISNEVLSLPIGPQHTRKMLKFVCDAIRHPSG